MGLQKELEIALIEAALQGFDRLPADSYLSLNVSPETILSGAVGEVLASQPLDRLMLEVTEHALVQDYERLAEALEPLRREGLRLAVDDAGAGYASFRHILKLKPDVIKLDASLIRNVDSDTGCGRRGRRDAGRAGDAAAFGSEQGPGLSARPTVRTQRSRGNGLSGCSAAVSACLRLRAVSLNLYGARAVDF